MDNPNERLVYTIHRAEAQPALNGDWDDAIWQQAETLHVAQFHARSSDHRPRVRAKALYHARAVHALFDVDDRYVVCRNTRYQSPVCKDSCVEFFVQPKPGKGYFNFEINCGGALLLYYIEDPTRTPDGFKQRTDVPWDIAKTVQIYHSLPGVVSPERPDPTPWRIEYAIPMTLFEHYLGPLGALPGQTWRGNFYKCAEDSSHPHWAAWAPIGHELNFHQPRCFGTLRFAP